MLACVRPCLQVWKLLQAISSLVVNEANKALLCKHKAVEVLGACVQGRHHQVSMPLLLPAGPLSDEAERSGTLRSISSCRAQGRNPALRQLRRSFLPLSVLSV